jgi:rRNA maturation protein Nop10
MRFIPNAVTRQVARKILLTQKHSPQILFVAGVVGTVTSTVMACRATLKLEAVVEEIQEDLHDVRDSRLPSEHYHKDLAYIYAKGALEVSRLYGPALVVGTLSLSALTGSHITLTRRNAAVSAAYAAVAKSYDEYRIRVREQVGEEKERDIYHAVTLTEIVNEDGKKELVPIADPNKFSPYAKFFDQANPNWQKNAELNRLFIQCQQNWANQLLQSRGHVFLNEVYDMLSIDHSSAGAIVGWTIGQGGDNYIDFGLFEARNSDFVNGWEKSILLDFNVDGVIYNLI